MITIMVESGQIFWQCLECDESYFDYDDVAYGHDCGGNND